MSNLVSARVSAQSAKAACIAVLLLAGGCAEARHRSTSSCYVRVPGHTTRKRASCPSVKYVEAILQHHRDITPARRDDLYSCLLLRDDPRQWMFAAHLMNEGLNWPAESELVKQLLGSPDRSAREVALAYSTMHLLDPEMIWSHLEGEQDAVLVERALDDLVSYGSYHGDRRMLKLLRRVAGPRTAMPMTAMHLLHKLIPQADFNVQDPQERADTWRDWLDENMAKLKWDDHKGQFLIAGSD